MNQFFEGLANQNNAEVTSVVTLKNDFSINLSGGLIISKGLISMKINYWSGVYNSHRYEGYVSSDDLDWEESEFYVSGLKVDSMSKFKEGLIEMGLSSVFNSMEISHEEIRKEVLKSMLDNTLFKKVFGKKKFLELLSMEEQKDLFIEHAKSNYETSSIYEMKKYGIIDQSEEKPSYEEFLQRVNK